MRKITSYGTLRVIFEYLNSNIKLIYTNLTLNISLINSRELKYDN